MKSQVGKWISTPAERPYLSPPMTPVPKTPDTLALDPDTDDLLTAIDGKVAGRAEHHVVGEVRIVAQVQRGDELAIAHHEANPPAGHAEGGAVVEKAVAGAHIGSRPVELRREVLRLESHKARRARPSHIEAYVLKSAVDTVGSDASRDGASRLVQPEVHRRRQRRPTEPRSIELGRQPLDEAVEIVQQRIEVGRIELP